MTTTDPRAWLAEAQKRARMASKGPWTLEEPNYPFSSEIWARADDNLGCPVAESHSPSANADFIAAARTDLPAMAAALTAVLDLHRPVDIEPSDTICHGCSTLRGQGESARYFPFEDYPCPTVRAITDALGGDQSVDDDPPPLTSPAG